MRGTLITLTASFVVGAVAFWLFGNSSAGRDESELLSLPTLGAAYCVGLFSSIRLIRSGRPRLKEIGYVAIVVHTSLILCTWMIMNTAAVPR